MKPKAQIGSQRRWAQLRFSVVGPLLASPPQQRELEAQLLVLADKLWSHPLTGEAKKFGFSTIERWYYQAQGKQDPIEALCRPVRKDKGQQPSLTTAHREALRAQYEAHGDWTAQLHRDNLVALANQDKALGEVPSYWVVRRYLRSQGLRRHKVARTPGQQLAQLRLASHEVRSYEVAHVHGLWHLDFHEARRKVLLPTGRWVVPQLLAVLDDRSRLCCHAQWYLAESCESLLHGLGQALQKRGLPRALLTDNGSAMIAAETVQGLLRLGIVASTTLPHSPYQNAKQEVFWGQIEGRLMPMLSGVSVLTLAQLNDATQAYVEMEYHRKVHRELGGQTPLDRYLTDPSVGRPCPSSQSLRQQLGQNVQRKQRTSDGTVTVEGVRYEIPSRFRHRTQLHFRYARFDLAQLYLIDESTDAVVCTVLPLDKAKNADGRRRRHTPTDSTLALPASKTIREVGIAPLLQQHLLDYASTGLPPAYLPTPFHPDPDNDQETP